MKIHILFFLVLSVVLIYACEKRDNSDGEDFVFVESHCSMVTVGGVVGIREMCFDVGDTVTGQELTKGQITIRIALHSDLNEGPDSNIWFQEFLIIPSEKLEKIPCE
jgi:hypothetical protein